ncbi:WG repeat-containing protein [Sphaerospermopsis sp. LEGE 00249]|uniref:WG repeat-containing protein n=1 Tax=Sphaerospermopsis sp. LEGE 00249 TaxID=1380707 RepID=UPI00164D311E|nr:WG repeat-containing protein [Sphaerospermopsis sp. LEGE 00249]MBC5794626.1 WG repeat-containing protein [Sphaerospermopsis sp. LEGE 00249]
MEIRGIWITVTDSNVLDKRENIQKAMEFLAKTGFNVVFPVVWNNGLTIYRSQVMKKLINIEINPRFDGEDKNREDKKRDPLQEIIEEAKKVDIAVIPWFEYGFMSSHVAKRSKFNIIANEKDWVARDIFNNELIKNEFCWLNSLDIQVQEFILSLFLEVIKKYDIAGIQGDDHFIALPSEGGYDAKTLARYQQEFQGQGQPPNTSKDPDWLKWRADILSHFFNRFHREIIKVNPNLIISMSPSVFRWGYENYLQDSLTWVNWRLLDLIHPQVYREDIKAYQSEITRIAQSQFTQEQLSQLIPGITIYRKKPYYMIKPEELITAIETNRKLGIQGEILFFYEGLTQNDELLAKTLQSTVYSQAPGKFDIKEIKNKNSVFTQERLNPYNYVNLSTNKEIEPDPQFSLNLFDRIEAFSQGIAAVRIGEKWGYIDKQGKLIGRIEYDSAAPFSEGSAVVKLKDKYGFIDMNGNRITDIKFDDAVSFAENMAAVKIGNGWGYVAKTIDQKGQFTIPAKFVEAKSFSHNLAAVKIPETNKWGYIDNSNRTIIPFNFDDADSFANGVAAVKVGNQWGYINQTGYFVIQPQFEEVGIFVEGLAPAKINGKWGYINKLAEFRIYPEFDFAKPFSQGLALVNVGGKWGYISR